MTTTEARRLADRISCDYDPDWMYEIGVEQCAATLRAQADEIERLTTELDAAKRGLAIVQQHATTAWNRGHAAGMRAANDIVQQATEAVKRDAWDNTRLTEALLDAEAERDALRADALRWREMRRVFHVTETIGVSIGSPATKLSCHWHGWARGDHVDVSGCVDALIAERAADLAHREQ